MKSPSSRPRDWETKSLVSPPTWWRESKEVRSEASPWSFKKRKESVEWTSFRTSLRCRLIRSKSTETPWICWSPWTWATYRACLSDTEEDTADKQPNKTRNSKHELIVCACSFKAYHVFGDYHRLNSMDENGGWIRVKLTTDRVRIRGSTRYGVCSHLGDWNSLISSSKSILGNIALIIKFNNTFIASLADCISIVRVYSFCGSLHKHFFLKFTLHLQMRGLKLFLFL